MNQGKSRTPRYIELYRSGELYRRVEIALKSLQSCNVCPHQCNINRTHKHSPVCKSGRYARVVSYFPHKGEERCLSGRNGSGAIFFAGCNLNCVFCQNFDVSQGDEGMETRPEQLAEIMLELQILGCHNINWVSPSHLIPQLLEATYLAAGAGLQVPIVYNSSGFDHVEHLKLLDGVVDIYMPDFKLWNERSCDLYLQAPRYSAVAQHALREMHRQVGDLVLDERGLARRGLLIRHLVLPNSLEETHQILQFVSKAISPESYINLMDQYHPDGAVGDAAYSEINRCVSSDEMFSSYRMAEEAGLFRAGTH